jgi:hypothetical protein
LIFQKQLYFKSASLTFSVADEGFVMGFEDGKIGHWTWGNLWDTGLWRGEMALGSKNKDQNHNWLNGHRKEIVSMDLAKLTQDRLLSGSKDQRVNFQLKNLIERLLFGTLPKEP